MVGPSVGRFNQGPKVVEGDWDDYAAGSKHVEWQQWKDEDVEESGIQPLL